MKIIKNAEGVEYTVIKKAGSVALLELMNGHGYLLVLGFSENPATWLNSYFYNDLEIAIRNFNANGQNLQFELMKMAAAIKIQNTKKEV